MKIVLWILQILMALMYIASGVQQLFTYPSLAKQYPIYGQTPYGFWIVYGIIAVVCGIGLLVTRRYPRVTPIAAAILAIEGIVFCAMYAHFDGFVPNVAAWAVWTILPIVFTAFIAVSRMMTPRLAAA